MMVILISNHETIYKLLILFANASKLPQVVKFSENQLKFSPEMDAWADKYV
jgi:hypothetical protein